MLTEELLDLVHTVVRQKAESQTLEVKAAHLDCPKRLYDTLSSFSNQDSGGVLLFGLDERQGFQVVGVYDLQDLQKKVTEQCGQMEPPVRAVFTIAEADGLPVCAAEIPAVDLSERPIQRADLSTLHQDALQRYLLDRRVERPGFGRLDEAQQMEMLNITRDGVPTLAAVLNFGVYPQGYLPQLGITAVVVPGREIGETAQGDDARFLDNKRIEGTIAEMVEEALAFCKRNMKARTIIDPQTGRRTDQTEYPISALREAILNALIHRDYSIYTEGTPVQLDFFTDRLEIHSPGSLYGRTTVEQLGHSRPDLRNPAGDRGLSGHQDRFLRHPPLCGAPHRSGQPQNDPARPPRQPPAEILQRITRGAQKSRPELLPWAALLAEEKGFEPLHRFPGLRDFESRLFDHLSTPPAVCSFQPCYYSKKPPRRQLPGRFSFWILGCFLAFGPHRPASRMASTAFWTCRRFSASVKISSAWASKTAFEISSPRWAGRQCSTMQPGFAPSSRRLVSW